MHIVLLILKRPWACLHWNTKFHPQALPWGRLVNFNESIFTKYWNNSNTHIKTTRKRQRFKKKCQSKQGLEVNLALQSKIMVVIKTMKSLSSSKAHWKWFFLYLWAVLYNPKYHKYHSTSLLLYPPWVWEKTGEDMKTKKADWKYYYQPISPLSLGENRRRHENKKSWLEILQNIKVITEKFG